MAVWASVGAEAILRISRSGIFGQSFTLFRRMGICSRIQEGTYTCHLGETANPEFT